MIKADFHIHTYQSPCSNLKAKSLLEGLNKYKIRAVLILDHNKLPSREFVKFLEKNGILVFVGEEIKTKEGEIIGFEISEEIPKNLEIKETIDRIKELGGYVIVPHPFAIFRQGIGKKVLEKIKRKVDFIETVNGRAIFWWENQKAIRYAKRNKIPGVGGSDSHFKEEIGKVVNKIDAGFDKGEILKAIKKGKNEIFREKKGIQYTIIPHIKSIIKKYL